MTLTERVIHLFLYEVIGLLMVVSALLHYNNIPFSPFFTMLMSISAIAIIWHSLFSLIFERYHAEPREIRSWLTRIQFTLWFKISLLVFTTPVIALVLQVNLKDAFVLDCILMLFGMIYTLLFNYCYDYCRLYFISTNLNSEHA